MKFYRRILEKVQADAGGTGVQVFLDAGALYMNELNGSKVIGRSRMS